jgi:hypothetical protein
MIFVFKTSVRTKTQLKRLKPHLDDQLPNAKWNFDLDDVDNILRIDSDENIGLLITDLLKNNNYSCEELE